MCHRCNQVGDPTDMTNFEKTPSKLKGSHTLRVFCRSISLTICVVLFNSQLASAQHHSGPASEKPAMLLPGMGELHHPIATTNPEAQKFFDQGLTLVYGF